MFKINKKMFVTFLERCAPITAITEAVFSFTEEGISVPSVNVYQGSLVAYSFLPKSCFTEYEAGEDIGLRALGTIIKMIDSLEGEELLFEKTQQYIIFYNEIKSKEIKCLLPNINTMSRVSKATDFDFPLSFSIKDFSIFSKLKKNYVSVGSNKYILNFYNNKLVVTTENVSGDFSIKEEIELGDVNLTNITITVGGTLMSILDKVTSNSSVTFSAGERMPVKVEISDFMKVTYLLATAH